MGDWSSEFTPSDTLTEYLVRSMPPKRSNPWTAVVLRHNAEAVSATDRRGPIERDTHN